MGFTPTFYASRPKLSEVTIDSDLDMGGRNIVRARIGSPYIPETWPTEQLDWGDGAPHEEVLVDSSARGQGTPEFTVLTAPREEYVTIRVNNIGTNPLSICTVKVNGISVYEHGPLDGGQSAEFTGYLYPGDVVRVDARTPVGGPSTTISVVAIFTGALGGPKTFDLTGKWLALGIDMQGLAATVKIQGVEMPYSDYAKYFPLAPTELTIPGGWDVFQIRPIVEVYK